ncbi:exostosin-3 [Nematostella vectensis]|uniref:exostosin-3 n=1 Tax=Nematostella vectensis TaxID=45351 RepID=UPI0020775869|nr:exostosin-3 [Nematostella vectensis]
MRFAAFRVKDRLFGRVILLILISGIIAPLVILNYLSKQTENDNFAVRSFQTRTKLDKTFGKDEFLMERVEELRGQISELEKIKLSLSNELRDLEAKRHRIQREVQIYGSKIERSKTETSRLQVKANRAKRDLEILQMERKRLNKCPQLPHLRLPKPPPLSVRTLPIMVSSADDSASCNIDDCFDFSKCSYGAGFSIYVYNPEKYTIGERTDLVFEIYGILQKTAYYTEREEDACSFIVLIGSLGSSSSHFIREQLQSLPHWGKNGSNHILLKLSDRYTQSLLLLEANMGLSILATSTYLPDVQYRIGFDVIVPPLLGPTSGEVWAQAGQQLPTLRKYFLTFEGSFHLSNEGAEEVSKDDLVFLSKESSDLFIAVECVTYDKISNSAGWNLCGSHKNRTVRLKKSTFSLVPVGNSGFVTHVRLIEALQTGAIPVILGTTNMLPLAEFIDWRSVSITLTPARIMELNTILRTVSSEDIHNLRQQGRFIWETYLSTTEAVVNAFLAVQRTRLALPAKPIPLTQSPTVFAADAKPIMNLPDSDAVTEVPLPSPSFTRNLTTTVTFQKSVWNQPPGAVFSLPSTPFDPLLPSSAPFRNSTTDFEVINKGLGGTGEEFSKAQGGNYPKEQFTVVMLTYERELVLMEAIQRLVGLSYLNKVVIVWNSPLAPSLSLHWPDIGVPVHVVRTTKNSLNNRFLPYDVIETDAILSIDDDVELRHDEILLAFRVWRENRDRIVGFPGRYHAWDSVRNRWTYVSNHSCELSLILTGAAFIHRYYTYLFTHWMQQSIREKIDEFMNCEDIAMNFLVSHITRKPPIKVTSRWTFVCSSCPVSLWSDKSHFEERHQCINYFEKVYGYMPLLRTQYRADSVLFKTRIPNTETKCFKYV